MPATRDRVRGYVERVSVPRFALHVAASRRSDNRAVIEADVARWLEVKRRPSQGFRADLVHLLCWYPEFRSLLYVRLGLMRFVLSPLAKGQTSLHINMASADIGPGLFIQHGFATVVSARSIGARCWLNQQVTVGFTDESNAPIIGDDVTINAGAMVIGGVTIGDGAVIGANAVAVKDVAPRSVVVSQPSRVLPPHEDRGRHS